MYCYNVTVGHVIKYAFTFHVLKFLNSTILGHKRLVKQKSRQHKTLLYDRINKTYTGIFSVSMPISLTASANTIKIELIETRYVSSKRPSFCPFMQNICCMPFVFCATNYTTCQFHFVVNTYTPHAKIQTTWLIRFAFIYMMFSLYLYKPCIGWSISVDN